MSEQSFRLAGQYDLGTTLRAFRPRALSAMGGGAANLLFFSGLLCLWPVISDKYSARAVAVGLIGVFSSGVMFLWAAYKCCLVLHVCEKGIRFRGTEIAWDDIAVVNIHRAASCGVNTTGICDVRIHGRNGERIHFTESFLDHVANKEELLAVLTPYSRD